MDRGQYQADMSSSCSAHRGRVSGAGVVPDKVLLADQHEAQDAADEGDDGRDQEDVVERGGEAAAGDLLQCRELLRRATVAAGLLEEGLGLPVLQRIGDLCRGDADRVRVYGRRDRMAEPGGEQRAEQCDAGRDADLPERRVDARRHACPLRLYDADSSGSEWRVDEPDATP